jgi:hypothetical protein
VLLAHLLVRQGQIVGAAASNCNPILLKEIVSRFIVFGILLYNLQFNRHKSGSGATSLRRMEVDGTATSLRHDGRSDGV